MNNLLEHLAIAICPWDNGVFHKGSPEVYWLGMSEKFKEAYRAQSRAAISAICDEIDEGALNQAIYAARGEGWESKRPMIEAAIRAYLAHIKSTTETKGAV